MNQQRFLEQLQVVLDPSKGNVKSATSVLQNEFYKQPDSLPFLIQLLISHDSTSLKQLAAVEARPLVAKHWTKVPPDQRPHARSQLLQATLAENDGKVRHAAARLISAIAKIDLNDGEWADLPSFLQKAATSSKQEERVVGTYILFSILETMGDGFSERFRDLFALFGNTIRDPESDEVRINTMLALSKMAMVIDEEDDQASVKAFQGLFPSMVRVLKDTIDAGEEDRIMQAFEVFQTLLGCDYQLMSKHFQDLVIFMNQIASNMELAEDTRVQAISFLMQAVQYRRLKIQGMKIGEQLVMSMLQIVTELGESAADDDDITPARSALGLIDSMSQQLPSSQVIVPLLKALRQFSEHSDPDYRRAGILTLGMCVEGAPDFIGTQVQDFAPIVLRLLDDPEVKVRQAALHSVARLADDVPQDLGKQHEKLMPLLFKNLTAAMQAYHGEEDGPNIEIMKAGCSAIDAVVDGMEQEDASPYLEQLAPLLQKLFQHPDFKIKALAASALGSLASTVEAGFLPYLDDSMHAMQDFATKKESEDELDLRASITDAMGEFAVAAGPEKFKNYVAPLMGASEEALSLDHSRLKESTYILFGSLAKVYEEEFAHFLPGVVKALFDCLDQEEADIEVDLGEGASDLLGKEVTIAGKKVKVAAVTDDDAVGEDGGIEDVEIDDDDEDDWNDLTTVGPIALEKEIAIEVLGDVISNSKVGFLPFLEKSVEKILPLTEHEFEGIRKATISTLHRAYAALWDVEEEAGHMPKWQPGLPLKVEPSPRLKKFGEILMAGTINVWADEEDRYVVSRTTSPIPTASYPDETHSLPSSL
jgi:importin-4